MRLFLNGNYIHLKKYQESPIDEYKIIVKSCNGERTVIDVRARVSFSGDAPHRMVKEGKSNGV